ncbi:hypothetical protein XENTR_v10019669 [Xenopus tropicalis]|uniref:Uncharacterized protein LOC100488427 isoform X5 n=1 Tax=Xenopus tropicalis TaxID=8364 RepID=A0A8J1JWK7_XENTR|nr:uncharacterized protein LOC100488427 isoform X5 [Xenopus tropicalis]KAE8594493.1 hypothetical protein XENTR_v10019669 [Xenopus tropicalis]
MRELGRTMTCQCSLRHRPLGIHSHVAEAELPSRSAIMEMETVPVQETSISGFFDLPKSVQDTNNIIAKSSSADLIKKLKSPEPTQRERQRDLMLEASSEAEKSTNLEKESGTEKPLASTTNEIEQQEIEVDIYQADADLDNLSTEKEAKIQYLVEGGRKGEDVDPETEEDRVIKNSLDAPDKDTGHTGIRENEHQEDNLEKILDSAPEDITESEMVVDGSQEEKNCDAEMQLHSEAENIKNIPDENEKKAQTVEDLNQQKPAINGRCQEDNLEEVLGLVPEDIKELDMVVDGSQEEKNYDTEMQLHSEAEDTKNIPDENEKKAQRAEDLKQQNCAIDGRCQEDNLEEVLGLAAEDIKESEMVVDGGHQDENYDAQMLLSEVEGTKQILNVTEEKVQMRNSDSDKTLVTPGEDIDQQDQDIGGRYEEKTYSEKFSGTGCENLHRLVTEEVEKHKGNRVLVANAKNQKRNNPKNKSSKGIKRQDAADNKGSKSDSEKLLCLTAKNPKYPTVVPSAIHRVITALKVFTSGYLMLWFWCNFFSSNAEAFPIRSIWQTYWVNGTNLFAQNLMIHNGVTFIHLIFTNIPQVKNCSDSFCAALLSNTSLLFAVREPPVTPWFLEYGSCAECRGKSDHFIPGGQFTDLETIMEKVLKFTSQAAISSLAPLHSTDTPAAPGAGTLHWIIALTAVIFFATPAIYCILIKRFCVRTQPNIQNVPAPTSKMVDGREESPLDPGESLELNLSRNLTDLLTTNNT